MHRLPDSDVHEDLDAYRKTEWLGDRFRIRMLPAMTQNTLAPTSRDPAGMPRQNGYLGFGAPALGSEGDCKEVSGQDQRRSLSQLCGLSETTDLLIRLGGAFGTADEPPPQCESTAVQAWTAGELPSPCYVGAGFTKQSFRVDRVKERLASARVLAFATHGLTAQQARMYGGQSEPALVTTPGDGTPRNDGLLSTSEIAAMDNYGGPRDPVRL